MNKLLLFMFATMQICRTNAIYKVAQLPSFEPTRVNPNFFNHHFLFLRLATPDGRSWQGIAGRNWVVDVDQDTRVVGGVAAGEGDGRAGVATTTTVDLELGTGDVELGAVDRAGRVQTDLLNAEQIFSSREGGGELDGQGVAACE
jgi:hypothetical protein